MVCEHLSANQDYPMREIVSWPLLPRSFFSRSPGMWGDLCLPLAYTNGFTRSTTSWPVVLEFGIPVLGRLETCEPVLDVRMDEPLRGFHVVRFWSVICRGTLNLFSLWIWPRCDMQRLGTRVGWTYTRCVSETVCQRPV